MSKLNQSKYKNNVSPTLYELELILNRIEELDSKLYKEMAKLKESKQAA